MALTLAEASKLSNDMLLQGVVETVVKDSPILQQLPFIEIVGNGLTYNQENALPSIDFYDVGDTWDESTPTFEQKTANLKIVGGDADVDNFLKATRSNVQDLESAIIELKAKALKQKFDEIFIYGDSVTNAKQFDGHGNYTFGLTEQSMFREIDVDKIDRPRGMDITLVTTATNDEEGRELLRLLGFPFAGQPVVTTTR